MTEVTKQHVEAYIKTYRGMPAKQKQYIRENPQSIENTKYIQTLFRYEAERKEKERLWKEKELKKRGIIPARVAARTDIYNHHCEDCWNLAPFGYGEPGKFPSQSGTTKWYCSEHRPDK